MRGVLHTVRTKGAFRLSPQLRPAARRRFSRTIRDSVTSAHPDAGCTRSPLLFSHKIRIILTTFLIEYGFYRSCCQPYSMPRLACRTFAPHSFEGVSTTPGSVQEERGCGTPVQTHAERFVWCATSYSFVLQSISTNFPNQCETCRHET